MTTFQLVQARYKSKSGFDGCCILFGICDAGSAQEQSFEVGEHCILSKNVRSRVLVPAVPFHLKISTETLKNVNPPSL